MQCAMAMFNYRSNKYCVNQISASAITKYPESSFTIGKNSNFSSKIFTDLYINLIYCIKFADNII